MGAMALRIAAVTLAGLCAATVGAKVPLGQDQHINDSLVAARVADTIRKACPTISARTFVVLRKMSELKSYARAQGYSEAEVKAFLKDGSEKARIRSKAQKILAKAGARTGNAGSYCAAGRAEIAKGSLAGALIRSEE